MAATIIIGIGSTGLEIIQHAEQFHFELTRKNKPGSNVEYWFLESDLGTEAKVNSSGETEIDGQKLRLPNLEADLHQFKANNRINSAWIPQNVVLLGDGAGGNPAFGRVALWVNGNFDQFVTRLEQKSLEVTQDGGGAGGIQVLVVGALTGGTGTGLCLDIAYLIRSAIRFENLQVNALFLLPGTEDERAYSDRCQNCYASLATLDYFSNNRESYRERFPDRELTSQSRAPYNFITILTPDFNSPNRTRILDANRDELYRVAGSIVALNVLDTGATTVPRFFSKISATRTNAAQGNVLGNFLTVGFHMLQYPKSQLEELLSIKLANQLLESMIDEKSLVTVGKSSKGKEDIEAISSDISIDASRKFEDILMSVSMLIDSKLVDGKELFDYLRQEWKTGSQIGDAKRTLYDLFSFSTTPIGEKNIYARFNALIPELRESFIKEADQYVEEIFERRPNLTIIELVLNQFRKSSNEIRSWYASSFGITGQSDRWNALLGERIDSLFAKTTSYRLMGLGKEYMDHVLKDIVMTLKLDIISQLISQMDFEGTSISPQWSGLPTLKKLNHHRNMIRNLTRIEPSEASADEIYLKNRQREIENALTNYQSCFSFIYHKGSMMNDITYGEEKHNALEGRRMNLVDLFGQSKIWSFLAGKELRSIYEVCIKNSVKFIRDNDFFRDISLKGIVQSLAANDVGTVRIRELFNVDGRYPDTVAPPMLKLKQTINFVSKGELPFRVCTNDLQEWENMFPNNRLSLATRNVVELPSLSNCLIFYHEYAYMNSNRRFQPLEDMQSMELFKESFKNSKDRQGDAYAKLKFPYLDESQLNSLLS